MVPANLPMESHSPFKDFRMLLGTRFATTRPLKRPLYHFGQRRSRRFHVFLRTLSTIKGRRQRAAPVLGQMPTSAFAVLAGLKKPQNPGDMFNLCAPFSKRIKMVKLVLTPQPALKTKNEKAGSRLAVGYIHPALHHKNYEINFVSHYPIGANMGDARGHFPNGSNVTQPFSKRIKMAPKGTGYLDLPCANALNFQGRPASAETHPKSRQTAQISRPA